MLETLQRMRDTPKQQFQLVIKSKRSTKNAKNERFIIQKFSGFSITLCI